MGLYDIIRSELECPVTKKTAIRDIQIKWTGIEDLNEFKIGNKLGFAKI